MRFPLGVAYVFVSGLLFRQGAAIAYKWYTATCGFRRPQRYNHGIGLYGLRIHREPFNCTHRCVCVFSTDTA